MDSKVKERIIGAAVLVVLGVWLFPWLLNGSDPSDAESPTVEVLDLTPADPGAPIHTETIELDLAAEPATGPQRSVARNDPGPERSGESIEPGQVFETLAAADTAPAAAAADAARAGPVVASEPGAPPAGWSVQVGSFGQPANAEQLASRVTDFGYTATVSDYRNDGRIMHRVRVGGFETREQADVAASSLSAHGFVPRVFPPGE